jgi:vWA-MoxR associated protein C-terminal domain/Effector-associated domain 1
MGLDREQRKTLRKALINAYPREPDIELMLDDELDCPLNNIEEVETYEQRVQKIIQWAEKNGKLRQLIIGASKSNPGNQHLRKCLPQLLINCFDDIDDNLLNTKSLTSLILEFNKISNLDFTIVKDVCEIAVPDISIHCGQQLEDIQNNQLEPAVRWLILLNLLLKEYQKNSQGVPYIIEFVAALQRRKELDVTNRQALSSWLKQVNQDDKYQTVSKITDTENQNIKKLQGHLLIFVRPAITSTGFLVKSFICIKTVKKDDSFELQFIELSKIVPSVNNDHESQEGIFGNLMQIEENLLKWEDETRLKLTEEAEKLFCIYYDLTIEFFLPYNYLATPVELWKVKAGLIQKPRRDPVGTKHQVVVRSVDRLDDKQLFNQLLKTWEHTQQFLERHPSPEKIQAKIEQLDCPVGYDWDALTRSLKINQQIALKLTCAMPNCIKSDGSTNLEPLFESILEGGTPIALWSRQCNLSGGNVAAQMDGLLTLETFGNLDKLLEQVQKKRIEACNAQSLGNHLAILCDEPKWLRQVNQFLCSGKFT